MQNVSFKKWFRILDMIKATGALSGVSTSHMSTSHLLLNLHISSFVRCDTPDSCYQIR